MKQILISIMVVLIIAFAISYTSAQGIVAKGLKGGLNLANVIGDDADDTNFRFGFAIGGFITYSLNEQLAIQPEIFYSSKGRKSENKESESYQIYRYTMYNKASTSLNYLEIPVLGVFSLNQNIRMFAGPYLDFYLNGASHDDYTEKVEYLDPYTNEWITDDEESDSDSDDIESDAVNSPGFGLILGAEFITGQISFGARYSIGLSNIPDDNDYKFKHQVIQFLVGFSIP